MDINRNQWFMIGVVLLLVGIQFRFVDSFVLNEQSSKFVANRLGGPKGEAADATFTFMPTAGTTPLRTIKPPVWLGWAMISVGSVFLLHSLAMKKPEGG